MAEASIRTKQLAEQYQYALVDEQFGRYDAAQLRLEYIIQNDPSFPGAQNELAKVLVQSKVPTPVPTATITPTPDLRGQESMFATANSSLRPAIGRTPFRNWTSSGSRTPPTRPHRSMECIILRCATTALI